MNDHLHPVFADIVNGFALPQRSTEQSLRLMNAAPDLLEALTELLTQAKRCFALTTSEETQKVLAMDAARRAIAKAQGEPT